MTVENTHISTVPIVSSEFIFLHVLTAIKKKKPLVIVRMGDGEAGLIDYYMTGNKPKWLQTSWLDKVGISKNANADIKQIGKMLLDSINKVDFLGTSIWALSGADKHWSIEDYAKNRTGYRCSNWYQLEWYATGCAQTLVMNCSYALMHNNAVHANDIIRKKFATDVRFNAPNKKFGTFTLYKNFKDAEEYIKSTQYDVYLISGGPEFKSQLYDISRKYNKVLLDIGHAITRCWAREII